MTPSQSPVPYGLPRAGRVLLPNGRYMSERMWREELESRVPQPTFEYDEDDGDTEEQTASKRMDSLSRRLNTVEATARMKQDFAAGNIPKPRTAAPQVPQQAPKPQFVPLNVEVERIE